MYRWAARTFSLVPTVGLGYLSWFVLLAGFIAVLRATGRGRCGWEATGVILLALVPIVWGTVLEYYHPEDLLAMGLALGGIACSQKRKWVWAGVLLGLAVTAQQVSLLVLVPLFFAIPANKRWKLALSSAVAWMTVSIPMIVVSSGRAWNAVVLGTGDFATFGGTVLWELRLHGPALVFSSRVLPVVLSAALAWWVHRRLGTRMLEAAPLISLLATSLSLRLVFEKGLFGYKFMALAVLLIVLNIVRGRIGGPLIIWLALVTLAFTPIPTGNDFNSRPWGHDVVTTFRLGFIVIAVMLMVWAAIHRRLPQWYLWVGLIFAVCAFLNWPPWAVGTIREPLPKWLWQVILVPSGVALAAGPLMSSLRSKREPRSWGNSEDAVGRVVSPLPPIPSGAA
jgi:hypothetical protein